MVYSEKDSPTSICVKTIRKSGNAVCIGARDSEEFMNK